VLHHIEEPWVQYGAGGANSFLCQRRAGLEDRQCRGHGDMLCHERANRFLYRVAVDIEIQQARIDRARRTLIGLLVRHEFRVGEQSMFKIVDANLRGLAITDRAEMAGNFQAAFVRLFHRGTQLLARDVHVGFERGSAFVGPEVHHAPRVFGARQLVHHRRERSTPSRYGAVMCIFGPIILPASISFLISRSVKGVTLPVVRIVVTPSARYNRGKLFPIVE